MDILTDEQHQVLAFIGACNRNYYNPTGQQVMLWRDNPSPAQAVYRTVRRQSGLSTPVLPLDTSLSRMIAATMGGSFRPLQEALTASFMQNRRLAAQLGSITAGIMTDRELVKPAETLLEHLIRLTWLEEVPSPSGGAPGLRLTDLSRALLRDVETDDDADEDVSVVLLGKEDPLAYPTLVGQLAAAGPGLLVDPYLKLADVHTIVVSTQLTRLLVSGKRNNQSVVSSMQAYLDSPSLGRQVEVRSSAELHDRVLLADDADVLTLGTSLNGVGRTTTVLTPIPSPARESLRDEYERIWTEATLVGPPPLEAEGENNEQEPDEPQDNVP
ncbi:hypothetical protein [Crystallibacter degradans]|uniref:hypothetical protein n=1 Tax=Crystallibacter degradans TaxID=2726743 RepID=UPI0018386713|nr:hypothetical protein [Arthrobacter sp. SF27]NMR29114.1 hypothetical protein [Arthrobacter sp. SF27]